MARKDYSPFNQQLSTGLPIWVRSEARAIIMNLTGKSILYDERNEHVLRRLGGAVIVHWDNLPADVQDCLLDQAALMDDRTERDNVKKDIETFLRKARVSEHKPKDEPAD